MRIAYFDCFAGAAGDMIVAAMIDAGLSAEYLRGELGKLGLKEALEIKTETTRRAGLRAMRFIPAVVEEHHHRHLEDIKRIIDSSGITAKAKETATRIFERLALAEAAVHGKEPKDIHFHEVGAMDSIADIVSAAIGFERLGIDKVYCSALAVGGGQVKAAHGIMPVPAPATAELLKGIPAYGGPIDKELLTPTGAAILTTMAAGFGAMPEMKIESTGYGAGTLESEEFPNVVRLIIGERADVSNANADTVYLLETNIDDASGEVVAGAMDKLLAAGALDVFTTAIVMKKSRAATKLSVICSPEDREKMEGLIFEQGLTFGIRGQMLKRSKLAREMVRVKTEYGEISVKVGRWKGRIVNAKPEFADCERAAQAHNTSVKRVMQATMKTFQEDAGQ